MTASRREQPRLGTAPNQARLATGRHLVGMVAAAVCTCLGGCAAWTNPVANGIPVRQLPPELLASSKENLKTVPLMLLRQNPPDVYRLASGDVLGVYVEGVLGREDELPPVNFPESAEVPPSLGYPIVIREDGTVPLPLIAPLEVAGLTLAQAEEKVKRAYTVEKEILLTGKERVLVTLIRPRHTRVLVIRQDSAEGGLDVRTGGFRGIRGGNVIRTGRARGTGAVVDLPAYENDVLTALARTGGLPGDDAVDEVVIERSDGDVTTVQDSAGEPLPMGSPDGQVSSMMQARRVTKIPLRLPSGQTPPFSPEDILLHDGDIVFIEARDAQFYYTGGLLPTLEVPLPRDYDLDVIEAISRVGGPLLNGGVNSNNLSGGLVAPGIGNPSPSLLTILRKTQDGGRVNIQVDLTRALCDQRENILVQAGDVLILQETPNQAFVRYFKDVFNFTLFSNVISRTDTTGATGLTVP